MIQNQPIGVFDSGVGGLTVAHAIRNLLPQESLIYFGDTAHLPYGDKSPESIRHYSEKIAGFLLDKGAKVILIACNTASALAYEHVQEFVGNRAKVFNVIDPVVESLAGLPNLHKLGIIGTKGTILSNSYPQKISMQYDDIEVISLATPLFAPMIEEGFIFDDISNAVIRSYLSYPAFESMDTLILGCTHYPIIKNQIRKFFNFKVRVIDSGQIVAHQIKDHLLESGLASTAGKAEHQFFVSDYTEMFEKISEMFFEEKITLQLNNIWK
ncbi:MAG: glutamate racemase [Bacteroidales bacterium]|nr:glutamate racemase [Bacteroidales bacterium]